jgi:hypothetical protein
MSVSPLTSLALALTWTPALSQFLIKGSTGKSPGNGSDNREARDQVSLEPEVESIRRLMEVEEASLSGFFRKVINFRNQHLENFLLPVGKAGAAGGEHTIWSGTYAFNEHGKHMPGCPYRTLAHDSDSLQKFGRRGSLIDVALGSGDDGVENRLLITVRDIEGPVSARCPNGNILEPEWLAAS